MTAAPVIREAWTPQAETPARGGPAVVASLEPLLLDSAGCARLCSVSRRTWQRLASAGEVPAPVRLGGKRLWYVGTLIEWAAAGCPSRARWERDGTTVG